MTSSLNSLRISPCTFDLTEKYVEIVVYRGGGGGGGATSCFVDEGDRVISKNVCAHVCMSMSRPFHKTDG